MTAGYSEMQIQKMGRWKGDTFKEYIREELACFSAGMSKSMQQKFNFVNITGSAQDDLLDVTSRLLPRQGLRRHRRRRKVAPQRTAYGVAPEAAPTHSGSRIVDEP